MGIDIQEHQLKIMFVAREDRVKAEKDALEAQQKAFAAPGGALQEVTNLRREILEVSVPVSGNPGQICWECAWLCVA